MLEVRMNKEETMVNVCGTPPEVMSDITLLIRIVHERLEGSSKKFFEESLEEIVKDKVYAKPVEELEKLNENKRKEVMKEKEKELKGLLKGMPEELKKILKDILK